MELPTYSYVRDDRCYVCGETGPVYRWDDYDESSDCVCHECAEMALDRIQAQAGAGSEFALSGSEQNPDQGGTP